MKKLLTILIASCLLMGCASKYQALGMSGIGYQEKSLGSNVYLVSFGGNGYTTTDQTYQYAMKRAAEITLEHGYNYFEVLSHRSFLDNKTIYAGGVPGGVAANFPISKVKIRFLKNKTAKAYNARDIFNRVTATTN